MEDYETYRGPWLIARENTYFSGFKGPLPVFVKDRSKAVQFVRRRDAQQVRKSDVFLSAKVVMGDGAWEGY